VVPDFTILFVASNARFYWLLGLKASKSASPAIPKRLNLFQHQLNGRMNSLYRWAQMSRLMATTIALPVCALLRSSKCAVAYVGQPAQGFLFELVFGHSSPPRFLHEHRIM
jgi:hypothetical protein